MSNYGVGGGPFPDLWLVDGLGIFSRGWIHQKYNEKRNRISKRELWQFQKSYQKSMIHRWWLNEFILDSWRAKEMEFFYIYWDCPSLFCTVRPARSIRKRPLKTVQICPLWWKSGKWFLPFLTSQKVQIRNKKRYKFDFLTENRFKPRSPLRTWPKNGQQNEIEKLKKFWFEMNLVGIIMNLEKLWGASVMDTWWVRLLVDS